MLKDADLVMRLFDRKEGFIAAEFGGVVVEDDYGDMPASTPALVWVMWNDNPGFPEHISRERLVKIAGFSIQPIANDRSGGDPSKMFPSRNDAIVYRTEVLSDPDGTHYLIIPVDEQGNAL